ncbi:MAG: metal-dependent transcriptional regulator [Ekhidna sp.]|nr:metal-dependent transcriptional regulator [Ekhidna sp.]
MNAELSFTEENYLKAMYHLSSEGSGSVNTNTLAESMKTSPASVHDMVKRLSGKKLLAHQKYRGATLSSKGKEVALSIIRKHRLWEVFLVEKLQFKWDEVHEVAEQLEHIKSPLLISRLDEFLGRPKVDPHGDPIPDEHGNMKKTIKAALSNVSIGTQGVMVSVSNDNSTLLKHLDKIGIELGVKIKVIDQIDFDGSIAISIDEGNPQFISKPIADSLMITVL